MERQLATKNQILKAVQKFNYKQEHGFKHLIAIGYMKEKKYLLSALPPFSPKDITRFIMENQAALSKDKLGEYFGGEHETNQAVLGEFVDQLKLSGLSIDDALRAALEYFTLPGESQQIDRIMQKIASKYV